jgi:PAS domain S-box-containing protein
VTYETGSWASSLASFAGWKEFRSDRKVRRSPVVIAFFYAVFGVFWLITTDPLLERLFAARTSYTLAQSLKGMVYVFATTAFVFWLARRQMAGITSDLSVERLGLIERLFTTAMDGIGEAVIVVNSTDRTIMHCNAAAGRLFGYDFTDLVGHNTELLHLDREHYEAFDRISKEALSDGGSFCSEYPMKKRDGTTIDTFITVRYVQQDSVLKDVVVSVIRDITEHNKAEEQIRNDLREKQVMLQEIHHRVKNNFSVIISLLDLQSGKNTHNARVRDALTESANRIRSMALVHDRLYKSGTFVELEMGEYIRTMVGNLVHSMRSRENVVVQYDCDETRLDVTHAIPCGLILNELVTNSLVHAFPDNRAGTIRIGMKKHGWNSYELTVYDDGIGLPDAFDATRAGGLGLQLVHAMAEQISGSFSMHEDHGTNARFVFEVTTDSEVLPERLHEFPDPPENTGQTE